MKDSQWDLLMTVGWLMLVIIAACCTQSKLLLGFSAFMLGHFVTKHL